MTCLLLYLTVICQLCLSEELLASEVKTLDFSATDPPTTESAEPIFLYDPPHLSAQYVNTRFQVGINISQELMDYIKYYRASTFFIGVKFEKDDEHSKTMISIAPTHKVVYDLSRKYNVTYPLFWKIQPDNELNRRVLAVDEADLSRNIFTLTVKSVGYPRLDVHVVERLPDNTTMIRMRDVYHIITQRKERLVDLGFTVAISIVGILNIFAIGCMTEIPVLRSQLKKSVIPVCLASGTQYIILPLVSYVMAHFLPWISLT